MPYYIVLLFIVLVAGGDSWACFQTSADELALLEANPICRLLIRAGGAELLVSAKVVGTAAVVGVVQELKARGYRHLRLVVGALAATQLVVVWSYVVRYALE